MVWRRGRFERVHRCDFKRWSEYGLALLVWACCVLYVAGLRPQAPPARSTGAGEVPVRGVELVVDVVGRAPNLGCAADAGRCEPGDAAALAAARVRVFREQAGAYLPLEETRTDARGRAHVADAAGALWVLVDAPGWGRKSLSLPEAGAHEARFELARAEPLEVTVLNEQRAPVADASVLVRAADVLPYAAISDREGRAVFAGLAPPAGEVEVHAPGYETAQAVASGGRLEVVLHAPSGLSIALQDESGQPLARAELWIAGLAIWPPRKVQSDEQGILSLNGLEPGSYDLKAQHAARVSPVQLGVALERGEQRRLTLTLQPGRFVHVAVKAGEELEAPPVVGADVLLVEGGLSPFPIAGRSDAAGRVELGPILPGKAVLNVSADGFVARTLVAVPETGEAVLSVALLKGATIEGRVADSAGRAVEGARIEVIGSDLFGRPLAVRSGQRAAGRSFFESVLAAPLPLTPAGELGVTMGPLAAPRTASPFGLTLAPSPGPSAWASRLDGTFRVTDVPPGRVQVLVSHPDYVESMSELMNLAPGGSARVSVVLAEGAALEGRVVDESGSTVAGARVDVVGMVGTSHQSQTTDAAGRFGFRALPRAVGVQLARPEDTTRFVSSERLELTMGERRELTLVLPAARGDVSFELTDASGNALKDAQLTVLSLDPRVPLRRTLFSNALGKVVLADAQGLALNVRVDAPGFQPVSATLDHTPEELGFVLTRGLELSGNVTHVRGRRPVQGASVSLVQSGVRREAKTDGDGHYLLRNVSPGNVRLHVAHPEFAAQERDYQLPNSAEGAVELDPIDLAEAGGISGVVVDREGRPVSGARVGIGVVPAFLPVGPLPSGMVLTDAAGRFRLQGVAEGAVRVSAYALGVGRGSLENVEVTEGNVSEGVEIRLVEERRDEATASANLAVTLGERALGQAVEVVVVHVAERSEAERAGLLRGDVLRAVDERAVNDMHDAREKLGGPEGSDVVLEVRRGGRLEWVRVRRERVRR
jgi:hypothetical protein